MECGCIEKVNEELKRLGLQLEMNQFYDKNKCEISIIWSGIKLEKIEGQKRKARLRHKYLYPKFFPLCGKERK